MKRNIGGFASAIAFALLASGAAALADDSALPARAVRLSSVEGQVTVSQGGQQVADHALANTPLFEGAQIVTADDGRAEIQFEDGAVVRIPPDSSVNLAVLRTGQTEIDLLSGEAYFELQGNSPDQPTRVRFGPNLATVSGYTVFRVQLDQAPGSLAVFSGNAHLEGPNSTAIDLHGGETVELGQYNLAESIEPDSWDAWNSDRDQSLTTAEANTTAATSSMPDSSNPAWSDLNNNGSWYNTPDGTVWSPYDASNPGWDPYGSGYWLNEPGYGYVWASDYGWGYLPFQCGLWNWYSGFGWGWAPGGCSPWWGGGGGLWIINIGRYPHWYHPPFRPGPIGPHHPVPGGHPIRNEPIIRVSRPLNPSAPTSLPSRNGHLPVMIGGSLAQPMPLKPAEHTFARQSGPPQYNLPGRPAQPRPTYAPPPAGVRTVPAPVNRGGYAPYTPYTPPSHPSSGGTPHPSGGATSHPTGGSSPHPSGGGGSPHPSGGGGGGSHPSGGGGGGSHPK